MRGGPRGFEGATAPTPCSALAYLAGLDGTSSPEEEAEAREVSTEVAAANHGSSVSQEVADRANFSENPRGFMIGCRRGVRASSALSAGSQEDSDWGARGAGVKWQTAPLFHDDVAAGSVLTFFVSYPAQLTADRRHATPTGEASLWLLDSKLTFRRSTRLGEARQKVPAQKLFDLPAAGGPQQQQAITPGQSLEAIFPRLWVPTVTLFSVGDEVAVSVIT